jgi:hypothetical protein
VGNLNGRDHLGHHDVHGGMMIKGMLKKQNVKQLPQDKIQRGALVGTVKNVPVPYKARNFLIG